MTREEMVNSYYTSYDDQNPGYDNKNYEEAQNRIKQAMKSGKKYVYLPGKMVVDVSSFGQRQTERLRDFVKMVLILIKFGILGSIGLLNGGINYAKRM